MKYIETGDNNLMNENIQNPSTTINGIYSSSSSAIHTHIIV